MNKSFHGPYYFHILRNPEFSLWFKDTLLFCNCLELVNCEHIFSASWRIARTYFIEVARQSTTKQQHYHSRNMYNDKQKHKRNMDSLK